MAVNRTLPSGVPSLADFYVPPLPHSLLCRPCSHCCTARVYRRKTMMLKQGIKARRIRAWAFVLAIAAGLGYVIYSGISARAAAGAKLDQVTTQAAVPVVTVIHPATAAPTQEIILPGNIQ